MTEINPDQGGGAEEGVDSPDIDPEPELENPDGDGTGNDEDDQ